MEITIFETFVHVLDNEGRLISLTHADARKLARRLDEWLGTPGQDGRYQGIAKTNA